MWCDNWFIKVIDFFCFQGNDLFELRRHAYSNSVDAYAIKTLVKLAFPVCQCKRMEREYQRSPSPTSSAESRPSMEHTTPGLCKGHEVATQTPGLCRGHEVATRTPGLCRGHEVAIPVEATVQSLDVREESISTLLCYLELQGWLQVRNHTHDMCNLKCYGGPRQLRALARKVPAVAAAAARLRAKGKWVCLVQRQRSWVEAFGWYKY